MSGYSDRLSKSHRRYAASFIRHIRSELRAGRCASAKRDLRVLIEHADDIKYSASTLRSIQNGIRVCMKRNG